MLEQLEQAVQVVAAVVGETRGEQRRKAGLLQLPTAPSDCAHIYLVASARSVLTSNSAETARTAGSLSEPEWADDGPLGLIPNRVQREDASRTWRRHEVSGRRGA